MKIKIGDIINTMLGSNQVHKLYKGSQLIYNYKDMNNLFGYSLYYDIENDPYLSREMFPYFYDNYYDSDVLIKNQLDAYITLKTRYGTTETFTIDKNSDTIPENISRYRLSEIKYIDAKSEDKGWYKNVINHSYGSHHKTIEFPDFMKNNVTELEADLYGLKDYENLFKDFIKLEKVKYLKYSHSKYNVDDRYAKYAAISAKNMFSGCKNLKKLHLGSFKVFNISNMKSMFENCKSLEYLDLSNWNHHIDEDETKNSELNNASKMFNGCTSLKELRLSDSMLKNIYDMSFMFNGCKSLEYLDLGLSKHTSSPSIIQGMFNFCKSLKEIDLNNLYTNNVTNMSLLFCECESLENVNLSNFNTSNVEDMHTMFYNCISLKDLYLDNFVVDETVNTENMMTNIICDVYVNEDEFLKTEEQCDYDGIFNKKINLLLEYETKDYGSLNSIPIFYCDNNFYRIKNKIIDEDLNISNVSIYSYGNLNSLSFKDCINVTKINYIDFEKITNIESLFEGCTSLEEINISDYSKLKPNLASRIFYGCTNLKNITINNLDLSGIDDTNYGIKEMFSNCDKLQYVTFNNCNFSNLTNISYMFNGCSELTNVYFNNIIYNTNILDSSYMFNNCNKLEKLDMTLFNINKNTNTEYMFHLVDSNCKIYIDPDIFLKTEEECYFTGEFYRIDTLIADYEFYGPYKFINTGINVTSFYEYFYNYNPFKTDDNMFIIKDKKICQGNLNPPIEVRKRIYISKKSNILKVQFGSFYATENERDEIYTDKDYYENVENKLLYNINYLKINNLVDNLFSGCTSLKKISSLEIDNTITNTRKMFYNCSNLDLGIGLNLSNWNTSNVTDMSYMFYNCSNLIANRINFSNWNTSNVTNMSHMFEKFKGGHDQIDISNFDTSKVTDMSYMFSYYDSSSYLEDFSNWNTSNVTNMSHMFEWNEYSLDISISNFDTSKVTDMSYMFSFSNFSDSLDLSNWNTSNVTNMSHMFAGVLFHDNKIINISKFNTSKVTDMSYMFADNISATSLDLSNFDTSKVTNMGNMFEDCESLISLDLSNFDTSKVTNMNCMFQSCKSLENINLSNWNTRNVTIMFAMFASCGSLTELNLSNFYTPNIKDIRVMFTNCSSLISLDLSNFDTSNVTNMSGLFTNCESLISLDLSNFDTSNVTRMDSMFYYCKSLISLNLTNFNTENTDDMREMFYNCSSLESLDLSSFTVKYISGTKTVKTGDMFTGVNCNVIIDPNKFLKKEYECDYYSGTFERI